MSRYWEAVPGGSLCQALLFAWSDGYLATITISIFHIDKWVCPEQPHASGQDKTKEVTSDFCHFSTAIDWWRQIQKTSHQRHGPAPAQFYKVNVEKIVLLGKISAGDGKHISDYRAEKDDQDINTHFDVRVDEKDSAAQMDYHLKQYVGNRWWVW